MSHLFCVIFYKLYSNILQLSEEYILLTMVIHFLEIDINYICILIYAYTSILKSYLFSINGGRPSLT